MKVHRCALVIVLLGAFPARADVTLSKMFSDHAVLQRDLPVPVWGTAEPGEQVTVQLGDAKATTTADAQGKWSVRLPPVKLNAVGQELTAAGKNAVTVKDVLVGDVWLCGGQSNMELALKECAAKEDIAAADFPAIRCLMTTNKPSRRKPPADVVGAWAVCTPANAPAFTGTGFYFARRVHRETGVPIGLVDVSFGGTQIEASIAPEGFELEPWLKQQPSYAGSLAQPDHIALEAVFNSKVKPVAPYGIKGALWYQGEWNGGDTAYYRKMRALIGGWRKVWNQGDFPFYFVQLPSAWFHDHLGAPPTGEPDGEDGIGLAITRMEQLKSLRIANTGMAVALDIGGGIHPVNKFDVGERLARWALRDLYGQKDLVVSGPLYREMTIEGNKIRLKFDHVGSGLMVGRKAARAPVVEIKDGTLRPFAIAGDDQQWFWADAVIDGADVMVSSPAVTAPVAVRYAYSCAPKEHNLYNKEGLPAAAFRTDEWGLMQPEAKKIVLFKAWPQEWDGDFRLQAPFDTTVEGTIRGNTLVRLRVTPASRRTDLAITPPFRDPMGFVAEPAGGELPLPVRFDAAPVSEFLGAGSSFVWDFGDGDTAKGATARHTYEKAGVYTAVLQITDATGRTETVPRVITVTALDTVGPAVAAASARGRSDSVVVSFSEPVRAEDAEQVANYFVTPGIKVTAASLDADGSNVTLTTTPLARGDYSVTVKHIRDRARKPNVLTEASRKFRHESLLAWWKLDEGSGRLAGDASGNNLAGSLKGATWVKTAGRTGLGFNGEWAMLKTPTTLEDLALPFSLTCWVNPAPMQRQCANIFGNLGVEGGVSGLHLQQHIDDVNSYVLTCGDGKKGKATPAVSLAADQWQHLAVVCDGENAVIYVDGVEKVRAPVQGAFMPNKNMTFGLGYGILQRNRFFKGLLSDFRIYRAALAAAEVRSVMQEGAAESGGTGAGKP